MNAPRHAGTLDPLEFSLVEFCQLIDFLLDIVSLVSFFLSLSVPYFSNCSIFLVFSVFSHFCVAFLTFFHWFIHLNHSLNHSASFFIFISRVFHSYILNPFALFSFHY